MRSTFFIILLLLSIELSAQENFMTRTAHLHLITSSRFLDLEADNYQVFSKVDPATGKLNFMALIKSFEFQLGAANRVMDSKALNVSQYPKAVFEGEITNLSQINFFKAGTYRAKVDGMLYIWDEKRRTKTEATLTVKPDGSIYVKSNFTIIIEEKNVDKVNLLMREKLPAMISIDANTLGISRNINVDLDMVLKL